MDSANEVTDHKNASKKMKGIGHPHRLGPGEFIEDEEASPSESNEEQTHAREANHLQESAKPQ